MMNDETVLIYKFFYGSIVLDPFGFIYDRFLILGIAIRLKHLEHGTTIQFQ